MKYPSIFVVVLAFIYCTKVYSQGAELISNANFENYSTCPDQPAQLNYCNNWFSPSLGTSDYFNSCIGPGNMISIGNNVMGYQLPFDGVGMAGIISEDLYTIVTTGNETYREYISCKLDSPLTAGVLYSFEFHVSLSNRSSYASSNLGAYFSTSQPFSSTFNTLDFEPQVANELGNFIIDTLNWQKIHGNFIAEGGESYVTIGLFTPFQDTLFTNYGGLFGDSGGSYYYIDGISLKRFIKEFEPFYNTSILSFSPNGDQINDVLNFNDLFKSESVKARVYSRWGNVVYECNGSNCIWNGISNSGLNPTGTYFYVIETKGDTNLKGLVLIF